MPAIRHFSCLVASLFAICLFQGTASALETGKARGIVDAILMQHGATATETSAQNRNGAVHFTYDNVRLKLTGYRTARVLALEGVGVTLRDTTRPDLVDIEITLPERGQLLAEKTSEQRDLTLRGAGAKLRWDHIRGVPATFEGFADFLIGDEPITRQHWLVNGLLIRWQDDEARIAWQAAEWTGPNREKAGAVKSANFVLFPDKNGNTRLEYAHDGLWLPGLFQPRTVRLKSYSTGLPWRDARPILQKGLNDLVTGLSPIATRRQIFDALWQKAEASGDPVTVEELYVEGRGLEALGKGQFFPRRASRYGFVGKMDMNLLGRERLQDLIGTPENPTLLGALVPFAVDGLAAGTAGPQGTTSYNLELLADGRIVVNGKTVFSALNN